MSMIGCFSCGKTSGYEEEYICISRLNIRQNRYGSADILEGISSLQICMKCAAKARSESININKEVPLLQLEIAGFYWFVKNIAGDTRPWNLSVSKGKCSLCGSLIRKDQIFAQVEIFKEVMRQEEHCEEVPGTNMTLAILCEPCSNSYMVFLPYENIKEEVVMGTRPIPDVLLDKVCRLIEKEFGRLPFNYRGIKITRELVKVALEVLHAAPYRTLPQNSRKEVKENTPDGLDRRIKERLGNLMTAPFISDILAKVGVVEIKYVENPESGRLIKGTRLLEEWTW